MIDTVLSLKADFVLQIYDDFTNGTVDTSFVSVVSSQRIKPLKKTDGCFVFINCAEMRMEVMVNSPFYQSKKIKIDLSSLSGTCPVIKIRILPNRCYPAPAGTTCLEGKAKPGDTILAFCESESSVIKLLEDYDKTKSGDRIHLYYPPEMELEGRTFYIQCREKTEGTYCNLKYRINGSESGYTLACSMPYSFRQMGTNLFPVYTGIADEKGSYRIFIRDVPAAGCQCRCKIIDNSSQEHETIVREITLHYGCVNRLDW